MAKRARLEIRLDVEDKLLLQKVAGLENCTLTSLLDSHIQELIVRLRRVELLNGSIKPNDSEGGVE